MIGKPVTELATGILGRITGEYAESYIVDLFSDPEHVTVGKTIAVPKSEFAARFKCIGRVSTSATMPSKREQSLRSLLHFYDPEIEQAVLDVHKQLKPAQTDEASAEPSETGFSIQDMLTPEETESLKDTPIFNFKSAPANTDLEQLPKPLVDKIRAAALEHVNNVVDLYITQVLDGYTRMHMPEDKRRTFEVLAQDARIALNDIVRNYSITAWNKPGYLDRKILSALSGLVLYPMVATQLRGTPLVLDPHEVAKYSAEKRYFTPADVAAAEKTTGVPASKVTTRPLPKESPRLTGTEAAEAAGAVAPTLQKVEEAKRQFSTDPAFVVFQQMANKSDVSKPWDFLSHMFAPGMGPLIPEGAGRYKSPFEGAHGASGVDQLLAWLIEMSVSYAHAAAAKGEGRRARIQSEYDLFIQDMHSYHMAIVSQAQSAVDALRRIEIGQMLAYHSGPDEAARALSEIERGLKEYDAAQAALESSVSGLENLAREFASGFGTSSTEPDIASGESAAKTTEKPMSKNSSIHSASFAYGMPVHYDKDGENMYVIIDTVENDPDKLVLIKEADINSHVHVSPVVASRSELQCVQRYAHIKKHDVFATPSGLVTIVDADNASLFATASIRLEDGNVKENVSLPELGIPGDVVEPLQLAKCAHCGCTIYAGTDEYCPTLGNEHSAAAAKLISAVEASEARVKRARVEMEHKELQVQALLSALDTALATLVPEDFSVRKEDELPGDFFAPITIGASVRKQGINRKGTIIGRSDRCCWVVWDNDIEEQCWPQELVVIPQ